MPHRSHFAGRRSYADIDDAGENVGVLSARFQYPTVTQRTDLRPFLQAAVQLFRVIVEARTSPQHCFASPKRIVDDTDPRPKIIPLGFVHVVHTIGADRNQHARFIPDVLEIVAAEAKERNLSAVRVKCNK